MGILILSDFVHVLNIHIYQKKDNDNINERYFLDRDEK